MSTSYIGNDINDVKTQEVLISRISFVLAPPDQNVSRLSLAIDHRTGIDILVDQHYGTVT